MSTDSQRSPRGKARKVPQREGVQPQPAPSDASPYISDKPENDGATAPYATPASEKVQFPDSEPAVIWPQPQRCSAGVAANYVRKCGDPKTGENALISIGYHHRDRRAQVGIIVAKRFGIAATTALNCERYLRAALERWLLTSCATHSSLTTYAKIMHRWCRWSDRRSLSSQTDTSATVVSDFLYALEAEGLAVRTICHHRDVLRSWFTWLFERDLIRRSPITKDLKKAWRIDHAAITRADGTRQVFTAAEAAQVVNYAFQQSPRDGFALMLHLVHGVRSGEIGQIPMSALIDRDGLVTIVIPGKGKKVRKNVLEPVAVAAWRRYEPERRKHGISGALIYHGVGRSYCARTFQRLCKAAARAVGRPEIASHDFRKTAATLRHENGWEVHEIQAELGHANPQTTQRCYVIRKRHREIGTGLVTPAEFEPMNHAKE